VLGEVADRPDGEIDGAVDFAEPGAAFAQPGGVDDVEEFQRSRRHAAVTVAFAERKLHHFVVERRCTPSHLSRSPPLVSAEAGSPNGSVDRVIDSVESGRGCISARRSPGPKQAMPNAMMPARHARENTDNPI
jgi:hypothetical protein